MRQLKKYFQSQSKFHFNWKWKCFISYILMTLKKNNKMYLYHMLKLTDWTIIDLIYKLSTLLGIKSVYL